MEPKTERLRIGSSDLTTAEIQLSFPHSFDVQLLNEMPSSGAELHYFPTDRHHDRDGVLLQVNPDAAPPWIGLFAAETSGHYRTGVYSCPEPNSIFVVSNGEGYVLDVQNPEGFVTFPITQVLEVVSATDVGLLIAANYTDVLAWDRSGTRWLVERISFDGIRELQLGAGTICGTAWSPVDGDHRFALDLETGAVRTH